MTLIDFTGRQTATCACGYPVDNCQCQSPVPVSGVQSRWSETAETAETAETGLPRVWKATDLKAGAPTRWLVRNHLPYADVAVLVGGEGIGKSLWWVMVTAHVTTGLPCPDLGIPDRQPADVVLVLTEDRWADVEARLLLAGADMERIRVICTDEDGSGSPVFPRDFHLVYEAAESCERVALVVVDAWLDTVHHTTAIKDPQQARQALHPWRETAGRTDAAVLLLAHSNRQDTANIRDLIGGTSTLRQKARALLFAATPPDSERTIYIGPDKANNTGIAPAVSYRVEVHQVRPETDDDPGTVARLMATGRTSATIGQHLIQWRKDEREQSKPPSAKELAWTWLHAFLLDHNGVWPAELTKQAATAAGHSTEHLASLLKAHGGTAKPDEPGGPWVYRLAQSPQFPQSPASPSDGVSQPETDPSTTHHTP